MLLRSGTLASSGRRQEKLELFVNITKVLLPASAARDHHHFEVAGVIDFGGLGMLLANEVILITV
jgi:hypothetical protein